jgi:hypothetical protein
MGVVVASDLAVAAAATVGATARSTRAVHCRGLHSVPTTRILLGDSPKAATSWRG